VRFARPVSLFANFKMVNIYVSALQQGFRGTLVFRKNVVGSVSIKGSSLFRGNDFLLQYADASL